MDLEMQVSQTLQVDIAVFIDGKHPSRYQIMQSFLDVLLHAVLLLENWLDFEQVKLEFEVEQKRKADEIQIVYFFHVKFEDVSGREELGQVVFLEILGVDPWGFFIAVVENLKETTYVLDIEIYYF